MGWVSRYGKRQDEFAQPTRTSVRFKHIIAGLVGFIVLIICITFFPVTVALVPKPQLTEYIPKGMYCATCKEMWNHNRDLFNREDMLCYGPFTHVSEDMVEKSEKGIKTYLGDVANNMQDRPTRKDEEVMYSEEKRCWALQKGHDKWMRPLHVTVEETEKWNVRRQKRWIS